MKIVTVIGARPQFIKATAVSRAIAGQNTIEEVIIHTGQHFDANMSDVFFNELSIPVPKYNLGINGSGHGEMTGKMLTEIENILLSEKPDYLMVYGDTNSTLAGALAAAKLHIKVIHIEAGLRSFNKKMPEEINRVLTDHVSDILFAPVENAKTNLLSEGIAGSKIFISGDVMYDTAVFFEAVSRKTSKVLERLNLKSKEYVLATIHRAENTDNIENLRGIIEGLDRFSKSHFPVILPIHPRTRQVLLKNDVVSNSITFIDPVGYLDMIQLEQNSKLIATDSGGVQKEAYFFHVPCVTLRSETEWVELVENGCNFLVHPINSDSVYQAITRSLEVKVSDSKLYGDGKSAEFIVNTIINN